MADFTQVQVFVPTSRVMEFYGWFAGWLGEELRDPPSPPQPWGLTTRDYFLAQVLIAKLTDRGRALFKLLAAQPERRYTVDELVEQLGLKKGRSELNGMLTWPTRRAKTIGRVQPLEYESEPHAAGGSYWMNRDVAQVFGRALEAGGRPLHTISINTDHFRGEVDLERLAEYVDELGSSLNFLTVGRSGSDEYVQAAGPGHGAPGTMPPDKLIVEYRRDDQQHQAYAEPNVVRSILLGFASGADGWRDLVEWKSIPI